MKTWDEIMAEMAEEQKKTAERAKEKALEILDRLAAAGVESVAIEFSGYGDSGSFEPPVCTPEIKLGPLKDEIATWAEELIEGTGVDWYNNDGGQGTIEIDVPARTYNYFVDYNVVQSVTGKAETVTFS